MKKLRLDLLKMKKGSRLSIDCTAQLIKILCITVMVW